MEIISFWWEFRSNDSYATHIWQVATLLGYGEPQFLDVFKNTLLSRLYWVPTENLKQVVETAKGILTKETIDSQQVSAFPLHSLVFNTVLVLKKQYYLTIRMSLKSLLQRWANWPLRLPTKASHLNLKFVKEKRQITEGLIIIRGKQQ